MQSNDNTHFMCKAYVVKVICYGVYINLFYITNAQVQFTYNLWNCKGIRSHCRFIIRFTYLMIDSNLYLIIRIYMLKPAI